MRARLMGGIWAAGMMTLSVAGTAHLMAAEGGQTGAVTVTASAEIDGTRYDYRGPGECYYTASGSIYDEPATMWHATFRAAGNPMGHASLAIWQLKRGSTTRVNLSVMVGNAAYDISTAQPGASKGTVIAGAVNAATGGRLTAEGRTAGGKAIKVTIACNRFDAPEDNGD